jgi:hypothetical protein
MTRSTRTNKRSDRLGRPARARHERSGFAAQLAPASPFGRHDVTAAPLWCNACDAARQRIRPPDPWRKPAMRKLCLTPVIVDGGVRLAGAFALDTLVA